ncbi:MAG: copper-translocating P-type ATPase [Synechococcales cyanobacterium CRU_2_2]|nr:copper-translocating P-type ATPase [Synechococcales cyanobacterium CRU_2_2]
MTSSVTSSVTSSATSNTVSSATSGAPLPLALEVSGMKCAGCVSAVEKRLLKQPGVQSATVNLVTTVATVEYWPEQTDGDRLASSLTEVGFPAQHRDTVHQPIATPTRSLRSPLSQLALAAVLILLSSLGHLAPLLGLDFPWLEPIGLHWGLATITLMMCRDILITGAQGLRYGAPNMNTLVGLGALSAYGASLVALLVPTLGWECFFDEPVMLLGFILLGRTLESQARHQASQALRSLLALQPDQANVLLNLPADTDGPTRLNAPVIKIPAERLRVGEQLRVLPSERIPADGQVVAGQSTVDESMLTGEFEPVRKEMGTAVSAGSLNLSGPLVMTVTQTGAATTLARLIELVETAQARKAPIQRLVDQVAGYFTYGVMTVAVLTFVFWYGFGTKIWPDVLTHADLWMTGMHHGGHLGAMGQGAMGQGAMGQGEINPVTAVGTTPLLLSLKLAIAVLVVACPCSLGLATPTAMLVGSGLGAERGLLIRGGDVLEQMHRIDTIVLDKTGTLTTGIPQVSDTVVFPSALSSGFESAPELASTSVPPSVSPATLELLRLAASLEAGTRHPLGLAIQQAAQNAQLTLLPTETSLTCPGLGIRAQVAGQLASLGNRAWIQDQGVEISFAAETQAEHLAAEGKTVVYVAQGSLLLGLIALTDTLRPDAAATVAGLRSRGITVQVLTGDRPAAAQHIAQQLQLPIDYVWAEVRPEAKAAAIAKFQAEGHQVAMVGDGINDAPALAQADIGIALRSGTEVAIETAQVVLMGDRLSDVLTALDLGTATLGKIRQNLGWAFAYNLITIPLAAGVLLPVSGLALSPALAGALMAFSSVMVVSNSLLLRWSVPPAARV